MCRRRGLWIWGVQFCAREDEKYFRPQSASSSSSSASSSSFSWSLSCSQSWSGDGGSRAPVPSPSRGMIKHLSRGLG